MKNIFLLLALCLVSCAWAVAQETSSKDVKLDEVVVEAKNVRNIDHGVEFTPTKKEIRRSYDGISLVKNMLIPMLNVSGGGVTMAGGAEVTIFIDGSPASGDEVASIRPKDVAQVQVLQSPTDSRFMGKPYVLNFTLRHPVYGGYIKTKGEQTFLVDRGAYSLSGMYWLPKSTLLYSLTARYRNHHGSHSAENAMYDMGGATGWVTRNSASRELDSKTRNYSANLKFKHVISEGKEYSFNGGVNFSHAPVNLRAGEVWYGDQEPELSTSNSSTRSISPFFNAKVVAKLGKGSMFGMAGANMSHTNASSMFQLDNEVSFPNSTRENAWTFIGLLQYYLPIGNRSNLMAEASAEGGYYRLKYMGMADSRQRINQNKYGGALTLWHRFNDSWGMTIRANMRYAIHHNLDLKPRRDLITTGNVDVGGTVADNHNLRFTFHLGRQPRDISEYNDVMRQDNDLTGTTGNPDLKSPWEYKVDLNYYWNISNHYGFNFNSNLDLRHNRYAYDFKPVDGVMYRYTVNSGDFREWSNEATLSIKLLDGALAMSPSVHSSYLSVSGIYPAHFWGWGGSMTVDYSFNDHLSASLWPYYGTKKTYGKDTGSLFEWKGKWGLLFEGRYVLRDLFIQLMVNPFYKYSRTVQTLSRENAREITRKWERGASQRIELTVQYVFDYGRKVQRQEEFIGNLITPSAIL